MSGEVDSCRGDAETRFSAFIRTPHCGTVCVLNMVRYVGLRYEGETSASGLQRGPLDGIHVPAGVHAGNEQIEPVHKRSRVLRGRGADLAAALEQENIMKRASRSRTARWCVGACIFLAAGTVVAERGLDLPDPGFESGRTGAWRIGGDMGAIVPEAAHSGRFGLRITDNSTTRGSNVRSAAVPIPAGAVLAVRFFARTSDGGGVGVYLNFEDAQGKPVRRPRGGEIIFAIPDTQGSWKRFTLVGRAPQHAAAAFIWVHSFNGVRAAADLDDFSLALLEGEEIQTVKTTRTPHDRSYFPQPKPERIAQIADMLPEQPTPVGRPIDDRRFWQALARDPHAESLVRRAEAEMQKPPPDLPDELYLDFSKTGNRRRFEGPYGRRASRLNLFVLAECLDNKGRFLSAVERELRAICAERSWVMPAHDGALTNFYGTKLTIDLGSSARAWLLATTVAWLGDRLPADVRDSVVREIRRRVWKPYLDCVRAGDVDGNWWMRGTNNWNPVCTANVVGSAMALIPDRRERAEFAAAAELSNPYFLAGFTDDGYCSEGVGYWNYGFGHYLMLGLVLRDLSGGRLDIFALETEKTRRIARYGLDIQIEPGIAPAFADCSVRAAPASSVLAMMALVFPDVVPKGAPISGPLSGNLITTGLLADRPELEPWREASGKGYALPLRTWFEAAQVLVCRDPDGGEPAFGAAIKGGHNAEHHNHNDVGSYIVVIGGRLYAVDPGNEVYTRRTFSRQRYESKVLNSYGHDVPVVAGRLQSTGRKAAAKVLSADFEESKDRLALDLRAAYDVPELKSLVRVFEFDRGKREVRVTDEVEFASPQTFETAVVTFGRVHLRPPDRIVLFDQERALAVEVRAEGGSVKFTREDIENPGRPTPVRIGIAFENPLRRGRIVLVMRPSPLTPDLPGVYIEPDMSDLRTNPEAAVTIQAEDMTGQSGGTAEVTEKQGADGKALKYWDEEGHAIEWRFTVPKSGYYAVQVRCCHSFTEDPVTRRVLIDGAPLGGDDGVFVFPYTGGWSSSKDDWRNVWLAQGGRVARVRLEGGEHTLRMINDCGRGLNLDWIRIVPVSPPAAAAE